MTLPMRPSDLPPLRDVIARHGLQATKALGQNFLLDEKLLDQAVAQAAERLADLGNGNHAYIDRIEEFIGLVPGWVIDLWNSTDPDLPQSLRDQWRESGLAALDKKGQDDG